MQPLALALTLQGCRTFSGGVQICWQPGTAPSDAVVTIGVGGELVWREEFIGDDVEQVNVAGDTYKITGSLTVTYGADGTTGSLTGNLSWTVAEQPHIYQGFIGNW
jgi:hypothetical protein